MGPTKVKNEQKGAYETQNDANGALKMVLLHIYYKVSKAYETLSPGH